MTGVDIRVFLPIISVLSFGALEVDILKKWIFKIKHSDSFLVYMLESLIFGSVTLVAPMIILALIANRYNRTKLLGRFVYIYFFIAVAYLIYKIILFIRKKLPEFILSTRKKLLKSMEVLFISVIIVMLLGYIIQASIYPLRGWDFLHFYLPNSFRIFVTGQLVKINEFNFLPQFKPPLNVFLYAYGFFVTQSEMINYIPILFLLGSTYLCYKIARLEELSKKTSIIASVAFLATPFTYFLVYEFQYYQEVFVLFFTAAAYYGLRRIQKSKTTKSKLFYALVASTALTGCVLSKISGYILLLVIFISIPSDKVGKILRSVIILGLSVQLVRKSIFEVYIGTGIFIALLCVYCLYLVISSSTLSFSISRWIITLSVFAIPLVAGIMWALHILTIPGVDSFLVNLYVNLGKQTLSLVWPGISLPETQTYLENAQNATFLTSSLSILIASIFAGTWFIFKIVGFIKATKRHNELLLWLVFFYAIWQGFFSLGSIRYLSPILVPLSIVFAIGIESVIDFFNRRDNQKRDGFFAILLLIGSAYLFLYPFFPFEIIFEDFHLRLYHAHTHIFSLIGYAILFNLLVLLLIWKEKALKLSFPKVFSKGFNVRKILSGFLIVIVAFVPIGAQTGMLISTNFDLQTFQETYSWDARKNYRELINAINGLGYADNQIVLSLNTPGLEYYSSQPVIDMFMLGFIESSGFANTSFPLRTQNVTRTNNFFSKHGISIFVTLNSSHEWYDVFLTDYYWDFFIYKMLFNSKYFTYRFGNEEFILFTIKTSDAFIDVIDVQLMGENHKGSLLARNSNDITIGNNASIGLELDLTAVPTVDPVRIDVITKYSTHNNETPVFLENSYLLNSSSVEQFTYLDLLELEEESIIIHSISVSIVYQHINGYEETITSSFYSLIDQGVIISYTGTSWIYEGYNGFVSY